MLRSLACLSVIFFPLMGCSGSKGPETGEITGKVTLDGKPVTAGRVRIVAADDTNSASGPIAEDGTYKVVGGPVGTSVKIAVQTKDSQFTMGPPSKPPKEGAGSLEHLQTKQPNTLYVKTPDRYEQIESSGITTQIPSGKGPHQFDIPLAK